MTKKLTMGCVGVVVLGFASVTHADTLKMMFGGVAGQSTGYYYTGGARAANFFDTSTTAGKFAWTVVAGGVGQSYGGHTFDVGDTFFTFCTELTQNISNNGTYTYDLVAPSTIPNPAGGNPGFTMNSFRASLLAELFRENFVTATTTTALNAAAFQMAVWEIVYQDGTGANGSASSLGEIDLNAKTGIFSMDNSDAGDQANIWLALLDGDYPADPDWLIGFSNTSKQDQVTMVPLPAPVWMAAVGLLGVVVGRRRLGRIAV